MEQSPNRLGESLQSERTTLRRLPRRGAYDRATLYGILDEGLVCQIGFTVEGQPYVLPLAYVRVAEALYVHGSRGSRMFQALAAGAPLCASVTLLDGLVLARSLFHHSMNYRSAVILGTGAEVAEEGKEAILRAFTEHLIPGRWQEARTPSEKELRQTMVLEIPIREASVKIRTGGPLDEPEDIDLPYWAGVLPLHLHIGEPVADSTLNPAIPVPTSVREYQLPPRLHSGGATNRIDDSLTHWEERS